MNFTSSIEKLKICGRKKSPELHLPDIKKRGTQTADEKPPCYGQEKPPSYGQENPPSYGQEKPTS